MNSVKRLSLILLLVGLALIASGCVTSKSGTFVGETKPLGNGSVHSWITLDNDGRPSSIGVTFTETALSGLPTTDTEYPLALPEQAYARHSVAIASCGMSFCGSRLGPPPTPFKHIVINWNPHEHEPLGIYGVPHFDFHFYMISPEDRNHITATGDDLVKVGKKPAPEFIPEGYVPRPGGEPRMGAHWIDPASPEFNNQSFTRTFIYGFYDGNMAFLEPMATIAYLETKPNFSSAVKLPEKYPISAYYPTRYSVRYDATNKEYTVSLDGMTHR